MNPDQILHAKKDLPIEGSSLFINGDTLQVIVIHKTTEANVKILKNATALGVMPMYVAEHKRFAIQIGLGTEPLVVPHFEATVELKQILEKTIGIEFYFVSDSSDEFSAKLLLQPPLGAIALEREIAKIPS